MRGSMKVFLLRSVCTTCRKTFLLRNFHGIRPVVSSISITTCACKIILLIGFIFQSSQLQDAYKMVNKEYVVAASYKHTLHSYLAGDVKCCSSLV